MDEKTRKLLRKARKTNGWTLKKLAAVSGVPFSTISEIERGVTLDPKSGTLRAIANALQLNLDNLDAVDESVLNTTPLNTRSDKPVPHISYVIGGEPEFPEDPYSQGDAADWLYCHEPHSEYTYALTVRGDSMLGGDYSFPDGCIVFCDPLVEAAPGMYIIARILDSGFTTFKRLSIESGTHLLVPNNRQYPIITTAFECIAVVIEKRERIPR